MISDDDCNKIKKSSYDCYHALQNGKKSRKNHDNFFNYILINTTLGWYLFRDFTPKNNVKSLNDLLNVSFEKPSIYLTDVRILNKFINDYKKYYDDMIASRKIYNSADKEKCRSRNQLIEKIKNKDLKPYKYSSGTKTPSTGETTVMNILDDLANKYNLCYFYSYRWSHCKNIATLEYDFCCFMIHENKAIHFNIEYDGFQHNGENYRNLFESIHKRDILKQYYLFGMNVHLLRLNDNHNVRTSIIDFINKVFTSKTYVIVNKIEPIKKLFNDTSEHEGLKFYHEYCRKMNLKCKHQEYNFTKIQKLREIDLLLGINDEVEIDTDVIVDEPSIENDEDETENKNMKSQKYNMRIVPCGKAKNKNNRNDIIVL